MHVIELDHDCLLTLFFQFLSLLLTLFVLLPTFVYAYVTFMVRSRLCVVRAMILNSGHSFLFKMSFWSKPTHFKEKQSFSLENSSSRSLVIAKR